ncbi:MAG: hypothetical protein U5R31_14095 [Acidimicrobiia bacterium]|nr:hypothetical protein [Acidimicrobiia bacterium]
MTPEGEDLAGGRRDARRRVLGGARLMRLADLLGVVGHGEIVGEGATEIASVVADSAR